MYVIYWDFGKNESGINKINKTFTINPYRDFVLSHLLKLGVEEYRKILISNFKGKLNKKNGKEVYFDNLEDAEKAIEWITSILFLNRMNEKC